MGESEKRGRLLLSRKIKAAKTVLPVAIKFYTRYIDIIYLYVYGQIPVFQLQCQASYWNQIAMFRKFGVKTYFEPKRRTSICQEDTN